MARPWTGKAAVIHDLVAGFPAGRLVAEAAGAEAARGPLEAAGQYLGMAERGLASVLEGPHRLTPAHHADLA